MQRFRNLAGFLSLFFCVFVVFSAGCSSEDATSVNNKNESDVAIETDVEVIVDSGNQDTSTNDTGTVEKDVAVDMDVDADRDAENTETDVSTSDVSDDVHADVEDDTSDDVSEDTDVPVASEDPYEDHPMGQCNENLECEIMVGGYRSCTRTAPGGLCAGCGDGECGNMAECKFGTCQATCTSKTDCAPGLICLSGGTCGIERCVKNVCPTPMFGCTASGFCERKACEKQADCPTLTTCTSGLCIEDRQL